MTRTKKQLRNKKRVNFHRNWKRLLCEREYTLQNKLTTESCDDGIEIMPINNETESSSDDPLNEKLKFWAVNNQISMRTVDKLLGILRTSGHIELPKSYRTLLNTPRIVRLLSFGADKYWYRGLTECLKITFSELDKNMEIKLKFNIDGLPVFKSSAFEFWPILAAIHGKVLFSLCFR